MSSSLLYLFNLYVNIADFLSGMYAVTIFALCIFGIIAIINGICDGYIINEKIKPTFKKWIKNENKKSRYADSEALDYALFEILAEYKRVGMCKKDILKGILSFNWFFLLKETSRRKKSAKKDGTACIKSAETAGLARTAGTDVFPIFEIGE